MSSTGNLIRLFSIKRCERMVLKAQQSEQNAIHINTHYGTWRTSDIAYLWKKWLGLPALLFSYLKIATSKSTAEQGRVSLL